MIRTAILRRCMDGPISAIFQSTMKIGQSVTIKPQILYLGHILDSFGPFIGII